MAHFASLCPALFLWVDSDASFPGEIESREVTEADTILAMNAELETITKRLTADLKAWLDQPSDAGRKIERLRGELSSLKAELGADALAATLKKLDVAERSARRVRQREAAEAIAQQCKALGVILVAKEPPKQTRVRGSSGAKKKPADKSAGE
jgi:hypothetical protein